MANCPAREQPMTVCLDLWETAACPPDAGESECRGSIRGNYNNLGAYTGGWEASGSSTVCHRDFSKRYDSDSDGTNDSVYNALQFLFQISNDDIKADRQNYLIVTMYNPVRYPRIPIQDDE